jgi:hypothetical protein
MTVEKQETNSSLCCPHITSPDTIYYTCEQCGLMKFCEQCIKICCSCDDKFCEICEKTFQPCNICGGKSCNFCEIACSRCGDKNYCDGCLRSDKVLCDTCIQFYHDVE